jgi:hypothetical protein
MDTETRLGVAMWAHMMWMRYLACPTTFTSSTVVILLSATKAMMYKADGDVIFQILRLLRHGVDRVEVDVGEEHQIHKDTFYLH